MPSKSNRSAGGRHKRTLSTGPGDCMTAKQAALLRRLAQDAFEPEAFSKQLTQSEAARRISALEAKLTLLDGPPHTL